MNLSIKQKQTHRHREQTYGYQRGWREINQDLGKKKRRNIHGKTK